MNRIEFLKPRLTGPRFEGHAIPLEVLKDLAVLEELLVEVARWKYLEGHPGRKRIPRGFTRGVQFKLVAIEDGSAQAVINLEVDSNELFPPENQQYFEAARDAMVAAVLAAERGAPVTEHLPDRLLGYFDRLGRSLRDDEACELSTPDHRLVARLTRESRRTLVFASKSADSLAEEVDVRGSVPEADQQKRTFEIALAAGGRVKAPYARQHAEAILEAFHGFGEGARILVHGIGRFSRDRKLQQFEKVEDVMPLDALDVPSRIDELRQLKDGWLEGSGLAPRSEHLDWFAAAFERHYPDDLPLPRIYPTESGDLQAEWSLARDEVSLEINLSSHQASWHALARVGNAENTFAVDLGTDLAWAELVRIIRDQCVEAE